MCAFGSNPWGQIHSVAALQEIVLHEARKLSRMRDCIFLELHKDGKMLECAKWDGINSFLGKLTSVPAEVVFAKSSRSLEIDTIRVII